MDKADIPFLSATVLAELIKNREISSVEAVEAYLDRIDSLDFKFNSFITVSRKQALAAAREAEQEIAQGNYLGPMHGIPVAVKDQFWSKGFRSTGGSREIMNDLASFLDGASQGGGQFAVVGGLTCVYQAAYDDVIGFI